MSILLTSTSTRWRSARLSSACRLRRSVVSESEPPDRWSHRCRRQLAARRASRFPAAKRSLPQRLRRCAGISPAQPCSSCLPPCLLSSPFPISVCHSPTHHPTAASNKDIPRSNVWLSAALRVTGGSHPRTRNVRGPCSALGAPHHPSFGLEADDLDQLTVLHQLLLHGAAELFRRARRGLRSLQS